MDALVLGGRKKGGIRIGLCYHPIARIRGEKRKKKRKLKECLREDSEIVRLENEHKIWRDESATGGKRRTSAILSIPEEKGKFRKKASKKTPRSWRRTIKG